MLQGALSTWVSIYRLFLTNPNRQGWVVSFGDTYVATLIHSLFGILLSDAFVGGKFSCANVPFSVNSLQTGLFCHILSMTAAFSAPIVSVLTDRSLNDSVIFGYTLQNAHAVFCHFLQMPTSYRNL